MSQILLKDALIQLTLSLQPKTNLGNDFMPDPDLVQEF
jgi:hypothetical protein